MKKVHILIPKSLLLFQLYKSYLFILFLLLLASSCNRNKQTTSSEETSISTQNPTSQVRIEKIQLTNVSPKIYGENPTITFEIINKGKIALPADAKIVLIVKRIVGSHAYCARSVDKGEGIYEIDLTGLEIPKQATSLVQKINILPGADTEAKFELQLWCQEKPMGTTKKEVIWKLRDMDWSLELRQEEDALCYKIKNIGDVTATELQLTYKLVEGKDTKLNNYATHTIPITLVGKKVTQGKLDLIWGVDTNSCFDFVLEHVATKKQVTKQIKFVKNIPIIKVGLGDSMDLTGDSSQLILLFTNMGSTTLKRKDLTNVTLLYNKEDALLAKIVKGRKDIQGMSLWELLNKNIAPQECVPISLQIDKEDAVRIQFTNIRLVGSGDSTIIPSINRSNNINLALSASITQLVGNDNKRLTLQLQNHSDMVLTETALKNIKLVYNTSGGKLLHAKIDIQGKNMWELLGRKINKKAIKKLELEVDSVGSSQVEFKDIRLEGDVIKQIIPSITWQNKIDIAINTSTPLLQGLDKRQAILRFTNNSGVVLQEKDLQAISIQYRAINGKLCTTDNVDIQNQNMVTLLGNKLGIKETKEVIVYIDNESLYQVLFQDITLQGSSATNITIPSISWQNDLQVGISSTTLLLNGMNNKEAILKIKNNSGTILKKEVLHSLKIDYVVKGEGSLDKNGIDIRKQALGDLLEQGLAIGEAIELKVAINSPKNTVVTYQNISLVGSTDITKIDSITWCNDKEVYLVMAIPQALLAGVENRHVVLKIKNTNNFEVGKEELEKIYLNYTAIREIGQLTNRGKNIRNRNLWQLLQQVIPIGKEVDLVTDIDNAQHYQVMFKDIELLGIKNRTNIPSLIWHADNLDVAISSTTLDLHGPNYKKATINIKNNTGFIMDASICEQVFIRYVAKEGKMKTANGIDINGQSLQNMLDSKIGIGEEMELEVSIDNEGRPIVEFSNIHLEGSISKSSINTIQWRDTGIYASIGSKRDCKNLRGEEGKALKIRFSNQSTLSLEQEQLEKLQIQLQNLTPGATVHIKRVRKKIKNEQLLNDTTLQDILNSHKKQGYNYDIKPRGYRNIELEIKPGNNQEVSFDLVLLGTSHTSNKIQVVWKRDPL